MESKINCKEEIPTDVIENILKVIRDENSGKSLEHTLHLAYQRSETVRDFLKDEKKLTHQDSRKVQNLFVKINRHPNIEIIKPEFMVKWIEEEKEEVTINN